MVRPKARGLREPCPGEAMALEYTTYTSRKLHTSKKEQNFGGIQRPSPFHPSQPSVIESTPVSVGTGWKSRGSRHAFWVWKQV